MSLDSNSWNQRYISKNTGWDIGFVSTPIKNYIDQINNKNIRILIPGCGNAHEAEYLFKRGFKKIFIVDFSKKALNNFKQRVQNFPEKNMICDNFFNIKGKYDLILEQTFFCAIAKEKRSKYAQHVHSLLSPKGKLVGLLFNAPMYEDHPPFGGTSEEYRKYFEPFFNFKVFKACNNSILARNGKELFINLIKK